MSNGGVVNQGRPTRCGTGRWGLLRPRQAREVATAVLDEFRTEIAAQEKRIEIDRAAFRAEVAAQRERIEELLGQTETERDEFRKELIAFATRE